MKKMIFGGILAGLLLLILFSLLTPYSKPLLNITLNEVQETEYDYIYQIRVENIGEKRVNGLRLALYYPDLNDENTLVNSAFFKGKTDFSSTMGIGSGEEAQFEVVVHKDSLSKQAMELDMERPKVNISSFVWNKLIPISFKMADLPLKK